MWHVTLTKWIFSTKFEADPTIRYRDMTPLVPIRYITLWPWQLTFWLERLSEIFRHAVYSSKFSILKAHLYVNPGRLSHFAWKLVGVWPPGRWGKNKVAKAYISHISQKPPLIRSPPNLVWGHISWIYSTVRNFIPIRSGILLAFSIGTRCRIYTGLQPVIAEMEPGLRVTGQRVTGSAVWVRVGSQVKALTRLFDSDS